MISPGVTRQPERVDAVAFAGVAPGPDGRDPVALGDDVPVAMDGAGDRRDGAAFEDHDAASRTASRIFS